ncbi:hypothetical protein IF1G_10399 [Cordyceps javanica]|uniref:Uncharacterized protein n=1 Tax=Cordyceps javanica TaxID=43265 RepID=A0A545UN39_9HYPO|nr:hypothetical protein IF1G_10399 [Cordyceps javanica]
MRNHEPLFLIGSRKRQGWQYGLDCTQDKNSHPHASRINGVVGDDSGKPSLGRLLEASCSQEHLAVHRISVAWRRDKKNKAGNYKGYAGKELSHSFRQPGLERVPPLP